MYRHCSASYQPLVGSGFASPHTLSLQAGSLCIESELVLPRRTVECPNSCRSPLGCQGKEKTEQSSKQGCLVSEPRPGPLRGRCTSAPEAAQGVWPSTHTTGVQGHCHCISRWALGEISGYFHTYSLAAKGTPILRGLNLT